MKLYLVINKSNVFALFKDQYLLFLDKGSTVDYAVKNGYNSLLGFNDEVGVICQICQIRKCKNSLRILIYEFCIGMI